MREELANLARRYINGEISLDDLEDWEASRFQAFASLPESDSAHVLWARIQRCIAEVNRGHLSERQCRFELRQFLNNTIVVPLGEPGRLATGDSTAIKSVMLRLDQDPQTQLRPVYIQLAEAPSS